MAWYKAGTVSVTNGSAAVVGVDALWLTQAAEGDLFTLDGAKFYEVLSITDNTHLTLASVYTGTTLSTQAYAIIRNFTSTTNAALALSLADMINKWHLSLDELLTWLTSLGSVNLTNPATGAAVAVKTPSQIQAEWIGSLSKAITTADVNLTETEASNAFIKATGALTGNRSMILPTAQSHMIAFENATTGAYTLTVKTAAGTGIAVAQGERALLFCDGTNVVNAFTAAPGINASDVTNTPAGGLSATTVQAALNELDAEKAPLAGSSSQAFNTAALTAAGSATLGDSAADTHIVNGLMIFNHGFTLGGMEMKINDIGVAGQAGFGVGICPSPPTGLYPLSNGTFNRFDDDYGNYQNASDGSVMFWMPAFFIKYGTGANGLAVNAIDIKPFSAYADEAAANAAGYALHRAFYDGGVVKLGVFRDKYLPSNNGGIASSLKNGIVLTSAQRGSIANTAFASLNGAPANNLGGTIAAAKTRGANFFPESAFIMDACAKLMYAHAQASTSTTWCAWYNATYPFAKGCNNNALGDAQDAAILYVNDGNGTYNCGKTGSANLFARTTHNGQNCGAADDNGLVYKFAPGITSNGTDYFLLNTSVAMKDVTGGNTLATDLFGATGLAAMYTNIGPTYGAITKSGGWKYVGSASQVFSEAVSGTAWAMACAGIPLVGGTGGTNAFGNDGIYDPATPVNEMALLSGGSWYNSSIAGAFYRNLYSSRTYSDSGMGFRSALYL